MFDPGEDQYMPVWLQCIEVNVETPGIPNQVVLHFFADVKLAGRILLGKEFQFGQFVN